MTESNLIVSKMLDLMIDWNVAEKMLMVQIATPLLSIKIV